MAGVTVGDVRNWAPTSDGLAYGSNTCTGQAFKVDLKAVKQFLPDAKDKKVGKLGENDVALRALLSGKADVLWITADHAKKYADACLKDPVQVWDCKLWSRFGKAGGFAYIHTGIHDHAKNGTTLTMSKRGSGVPEIVNPAMDEFMQTEEYYEICKKHDLVHVCYSNEYFPAADPPEAQPHDLATKDLQTTCSDGFCPCPDSSAP